MMSLFHFLKRRSYTTLLASSLIFSAPAFAADAIQWQPWSAAAFTQAKQEHKLLILDLEAVWCHWCHVMNQKTYSNPSVIQEINTHFIPLRVDQDSRPDLANRFRDYGWPATIIFSAEGQPLVKRAGFIEAVELKDTLEKIAAKPVAETDEQAGEEENNAATAPDSQRFALSAALKKSLQEDFITLYDTRYGSWGAGAQKFMDGVSVELAIKQAQAGNVKALGMAQKTLTEEMHLIDPIWGGAYQYSTGGVWTKPHTEKIMSVQTDALRAYALAYSQWKRPQDLKSARQIAHYMQTFLHDSKTDAFFVSQDADAIAGKHDYNYFKLPDAARRKIGIPKVDQHIYARENGWAIEALSEDYQMTGEPSSLKSAIQAAEWITANRALEGGGFKHNAENESGPYLGDTLAMGQGFLSLYTSTGERAWLQQAQEAHSFIEKNFKADKEAGYWTAQHAEFPYVDRTENLQLARWANLLSQVTGKAEQRQTAENALEAIARKPSVAEDSFPALPLIANEELQEAPLHLTVMGKKNDPAAAKLFKEAIRYPAFYKRVEWWDVSEGPLVNPDVTYPNLPHAAAYICTNHRCSLPITDAALLRLRIQQLSQKRKGR
jgi:uncharacterized protein YyaL (SSP411 family)